MQRAYLLQRGQEELYSDGVPRPDLQPPDPHPPEQRRRPPGGSGWGEKGLPLGQAPAPPPSRAGSLGAAGGKVPGGKAGHHPPRPLPADYGEVGRWA